MRCSPASSATAGRPRTTTSTPSRPRAQPRRSASTSDERRDRRRARVDPRREAHLQPAEGPDRALQPHVARRPRRQLRDRRRPGLRGRVELPQVAREPARPAGHDERGRDAAGRRRGERHADRPPHRQPARGRAPRSRPATGRGSPASPPPRAARRRPARPRPGRAGAAPDHPGHQPEGEAPQREEQGVRRHGGRDERRPWAPARTPRPASSCAPRSRPSSSPASSQPDSAKSASSGTDHSRTRKSRSSTSPERASWYGHRRVEVVGGRVAGGRARAAAVAPRRRRQRGLLALASAPPRPRSSSGRPRCAGRRPGSRSRARRGAAPSTCRRAARAGRRRPGAGAAPRASARRRSAPPRRAPARPARRAPTPPPRGAPRRRASAAPRARRACASPHTLSAVPSTIARRQRILRCSRSFKSHTARFRLPRPVRLPRPREEPRLVSRFEIGFARAAHRRCRDHRRGRLLRHRRDRPQPPGLGGEGQAALRRGEGLRRARGQAPEARQPRALHPRDVQQAVRERELLRRDLRGAPRGARVRPRRVRRAAGLRGRDRHDVLRHRVRPRARRTSWPSSTCRPTRSPPRT